jgi:hypothetical protein
MGFASGSVTFRRLAVISHAGKPIGTTEEILDGLRRDAVKERDLGVPEEVEYGWSGGRHIFDVGFSFDNNVYGDAVMFALRIDTNKAPGDLKKAYQAMEEEAAAAENPSGFLSKAQKKDVKDAVKAKLEDELRDGRHRRSKLVPVLWDTARNVVYSPATGQSLEKLREIFERTFGALLEPLGAGAIALRHLEPIGKRRDYEDLKPTRFVIGPEGEGQVPEYPWVAKGPEPKEFVGNEFLIWLWRETETHEGTIPLTDRTDATVFFDRSLDLDCAYGQTGRDALRGDGPTKMPEARDALRSGKLPRKAGLIIDTAGEQFAFNFAAEGFAFNSLKLPEVEADTARELIEARIEHMATICKTMDDLYQSFLKVRTSSAWAGWTVDARKWIAAAPKAGARVSVEIHAAARRAEREAVEAE